MFYHYDIEPFVKLDAKADIKLVHELLCPDLNLVLLNFQYIALCQNKELKRLNLVKLTSRLGTSGISSTNEEIFTAFARLLAATPHSADVERSISANNRLKTPLRSSIDINTENGYLFVHYNLPPLVEWNPRKAVVHWLKKKLRRDYDIKIDNVRRKSKYQRHFKGVFSKMDENSDDEDEQALDQVINEQPNKRRNIDC